jgi:radical SAM protein with 4Fe4S-binding SPASM domain
MKILKKTKQQYLVETPERIYGQRENLAEKILSKKLGEKYIEYRKKWLAASKRELLTEFPLYIQIEYSGKCNLHCPTCPQGIKNLRENYSKGFKFLTDDLFEKIIIEAKKYHCPSLAFHNNDEPLLIPDLGKKIRKAKELGFLDIIMTTNASLLTKEKTRELLGSGITKINFSVDAASVGDYKKTRPGSNFKKVVQNIEYFMKERKKNGLNLPITRATCVLTRFTEKNIQKFKKFWVKRVDMVEFQNFQALKGYTEYLKPAVSRVDKNFMCNLPWQQLVVRANGDVLPCCSFYGTALVLGNIKNDSLYDLWYGRKMEKIRKELLKNNFDFSPVCKNCSETFYVKD